MGCIAGAYGNGICSCRECRSTCPVMNRRCSPRMKCDDCAKDDKEMDRILGLDKKQMEEMEKLSNAKRYKVMKEKEDMIFLAKQKVIDAVRAYRLLLETDKNEKLEEVLRELTII